MNRYIEIFITIFLSKDNCTFNTHVVQYINCGCGIDNEKYRDL